MIDFSFGKINCHNLGQSRVASIDKLSVIDEEITERSAKEYAIVSILLNGVHKIRIGFIFSISRL